MKSLAFIISVYVLVLTAIPCADNHAAETNILSIELHEQDQNQHDDGDSCSPFCFCNCCQTHSQITKNHTFQINLQSFNLLISPLAQDEMESTIPFWRPPQS